MAKIFLVISILVSAITGGLAFMAKGKIDGVKDERERALTNVQNEKVRADKQADEVKKKEAELATHKTDLEKKSTELAAATKAREDAENERKELKEVADKAMAAKAKAEADLAVALNDPTKKNPIPDDPNASPVVQKLTADLAQKEQDLKKAQEVQDSLIIRERNASEKLAEANKRIETYQAPIRRQGVMGRIISVNPSWNFVVVDVGDNRGATVNSPLLVVRGGSVVGKLRITSVEPSTSIADLIPGSVPKGSTVQPGDRVVFSGRQIAPSSSEGAEGAASAPAPSAPAPGAPVPPAR